MRLKDKVAIVTGGASGMGKATAEAFVKEGAKVTVIDKKISPKVAGEIKNMGGLAIEADVTKTADIDRAVVTTVKTFGKVDILANFAGILLSADLEHHTEKIWDDTINVNLKGTFLCIQGVVPEMLKQGKGKVINIASVAGQIGFPNAAAYCASKGAIMGMTKALACELAPKKINVNAIAPGDIETALNAHLLRDPVYLKSRIDQTPYGRVGQVPDIAPAAVYLASDESDFACGVILTIDGGLTSQ